MNRTEPLLDFSVVIPTCNRPDSLRKTLECLHPERQAMFDPANSSREIAYEVIVSDDSPGDETRRMIEQSFPWVRYTRGPHKGPAANRNNGASIANGSWLAFTDDDCLPQVGWLAEFAKNSPGNKILEGKTIADKPRERLDEESPINTTGGYLWSCNFGIRRDLFEEIGGFDVQFPHPAMEDVELRERLKYLGLESCFCDNAVVIHPWRRSKGLKHRRRELESWYRLNQLHPHQAPKKLSRYFFHRSVRTFFKVTIPGAIQYRCRGLGYALSMDFFYLMQGLLHYIKRN